MRRLVKAPTPYLLKARRASCGPAGHGGERRIKKKNEEKVEEEDSERERATTTEK